MGLFFLVGNP